MPGFPHPSQFGSQNSSNDPIKAIIDERGKVYGDPIESWSRVAEAWTAFLKSYQDGDANKPLTPSAAVKMMVMLKLIRTSQQYHADSFLDGHAYLQFAEEFQKAGK